MCRHTRLTLTAVCTRQLVPSMRSGARHHVGAFLVLAACVFSCHAACLQRIARFPHGQVVTTRSLLNKPYRSLAESTFQQQHVWVLGLHPHHEAQVHTTLQAHHGKLLHPLPGKDHHHWLVQATETAVRALLTAHDEATAAYMPHELKVSPTLAEQVSRKAQQGVDDSITLLLLLPAATASSHASFVQHSRRYLATILEHNCASDVSFHDNLVRISVCMKAAMHVARWAASHPEVTWVDVKTARSTHSLYASAITQNPSKLHQAMGKRTSPPPEEVLNGTASDYFPLWKAGITGKGQVVAIADTGIDMDSCFFHDTKAPNIYANITQLTVPCPEGYFGKCKIDNGLTGTAHAPVNHSSIPQHRKVAEFISVSGRFDTSGHGTLTASVLAGSQQGFNAQTDKPILGTGICPDCKLAVVDIGADLPGDDATDNVPAPVLQYLEQKVGARIISQSNGMDANIAAYYGLECFTLDKAAWNGSNLLHVFSAGNDGYLARYERNTNGTVAVPATCKDVLSVGGTENWMTTQENRERSLNEAFRTFNILMPNNKPNLTEELEYIARLRLPWPDQTNPGLLTFSQRTSTDTAPVHISGPNGEPVPLVTSTLPTASPKASPHPSPSSPRQSPTLSMPSSRKQGRPTTEHVDAASGYGYGYGYDNPPSSPPTPHPSPKIPIATPSPRSSPSPPTLPKITNTTYNPSEQQASPTTTEPSASALPESPINLNGSTLDFVTAPGYPSNFWQSLGSKQLEKFIVNGRGTVEFQLVLAEPPEGCNLKPNFDNTSQVMLLVRKSSVDIFGDYDYVTSTCSVGETAIQAQQIGAAAVLVYWEDTVYQSSPFASLTSGSLFMPTPMITKPGVGEQLAELLSHGVKLTATWHYVPPYRPTDALPFENVASWSGYSSLNRTHQTRFKPDLVAPGFQLASHSDLKFSGKVDNCAVVRDEGTSMAAPVVSGAAAMTRQWFLDGYYPSGHANPTNTYDPSAALLKAAVIAGTAAMTGYSMVNGQRLAPPPSPYQGYGRLDLSRTLPLSSNPEWSMQASDSVPGFPVQLSATGKADTYTVKVSKAEKGPQPDLIVTLVWMDYPGYPGVASNFPLVNDLDLVVMEPRNGSGAGAHWGNGVPGGDRVNNVEKVVIPQAIPGTYTIKVAAHYIFVGASPQPYAMLVLGHVSELSQSTAA